VERQATFDQAIAGMSEQVRQAERSTSERLRHQAQELARTIVTAEQRLGDEVDRLDQAIGQTREALIAQERLLRDQITEERNTRQQELQAVRHQIARLEESEAEARETARVWLRDAETLQDVVRDTLPHQRFAPGALERLRTKLDTASGNLDAGLWQAAVAATQAVYHDLSELRLLVEERDREWRLVQAAATEAVRTIQHLIDENRIRKAVDAEGHTLNDDLDVDYWTEGAHSLLEQEAADLFRRVTANVDPLTTDELRAVVEQTAPEMETRLRDLARDAGVNLLAHYMRVSIADTIADTLIHQNFYALQEGGWVGGDDREEFTAKFRNEGGDEIVVIVSNDEIQLHSFDKPPVGERQRLDRAQAVTKSLKDQGLRVGDPDETQTVPDQELRDLTSILRQGLPEHRTRSHRQAMPLVEPASTQPSYHRQEG